MTQKLILPRLILISIVVSLVFLVLPILPALSKEDITKKIPLNSSPGTVYNKFARGKVSLEDYLAWRLAHDTTPDWIRKRYLNRGKRSGITLKEVRIKVGGPISKSSKVRKTIQKIEKPGGYCCEFWSMNEMDVVTYQRYLVAQQYKFNFLIPVVDIKGIHGKLIDRMLLVGMGEAAEKLGRSGKLAEIITDPAEILKLGGPIAVGGYKAWTIGKSHYKDIIGLLNQYDNLKVNEWKHLGMNRWVARVEGSRLVPLYQEIKPVDKTKKSWGAKLLGVYPCRMPNYFFYGDPALLKRAAEHCKKGKKVSLKDAVEKNKVKFAMYGDGHTTSSVNVSLKLDESAKEKMDIYIPPYQVLVPDKEGYQNMMTTEGQAITLRPGEELHRIISSVCISGKNIPPPPAKEEGVAYRPQSLENILNYIDLVSIVETAQWLEHSKEFDEVPIPESRRRETIQQLALWKTIGEKTDDPEDNVTKETIKNDLMKVAHVKESELKPKQKEKLDEGVAAIFAAVDLTLKRRTDDRIQDI